MYRFAYHEIVPTLWAANRGRRLRVPALVLGGARDVQLSPRSLGGYERCADDLKVEVMPDSGHFLPEERPALVAASARAFFASETPRPLARSSPTARADDRQAPEPLIANARADDRQRREPMIG